MNVKVMRVAAGPEVRGLVEAVLGEASAMAAMPEGQRTAAWREELCGRVERGEVFMYVPFDYGRDVPRAMGVYWAEPCGAGAAFGHQFMERGSRRGLAAVAAVKACARRFFDDFPQVDVVFGLTPVWNVKALAVAKRAGFRDMGEVSAGGGRCRLLVFED